MDGLLVSERGIVPTAMENLPIPTVVVVDDEALIRWALSQGLLEAGFPVMAAETGKEAKRLLETLAGTPRVVILDLRLPDVVDLSLLREIRTRWPDVPVVMMTAHGSSEDATAALRIGAYSFVSKPFDVPQMVALVGAAWAAGQHDAR